MSKVYKVYEKKDFHKTLINHEGENYNLTGKTTIKTPLNQVIKATSITAQIDIICLLTGCPGKSPGLPLWDSVQSNPERKSDKPKFREFLQNNWPRLYKKWLGHKRQLQRGAIPN